MSTLDVHFLQNTVLNQRITCLGWAYIYQYLITHLNNSLIKSSLYFTSI